MLANIFDGLTKHAGKWENFFDVYERHTSKLVGKSPRILEIGVLDGGSIEMWAKYFGEGTTTIGVDIDPRCLQYKYEHDNYQILLGNQGDPEFWDNFVQEHQKGFDLIVDDGSHLMTHQILTLEKCWPILKHGGVYAVEDTHTSYFDTHKDSNVSAMQYLKNLSDIPTQQFFGGNSPYGLTTYPDTYRDLYSICFYNSIVILEKEQYKPVDCLGPNGERLVW